jgi:hypothetical protein
MGKDLDTGEKAGPHDKAVTGLYACANWQRYETGCMQAAHARPPHQSLQTRAIDSRGHGCSIAAPHGRVNGNMAASWAGASAWPTMSWVCVKSPREGGQFMLGYCCGHRRVAQQRSTVPSLGRGNAMSYASAIHTRMSSSSEQYDSPPALAAWRPAGVGCSTKGGCTYVHRHHFTRAL